MLFWMVNWSYDVIVKWFQDTSILNRLNQIVLVIGILWPPCVWLISWNINQPASMLDASLVVWKINHRKSLFRLRSQHHKLMHVQKMLYLIIINNIFRTIFLKYSLQAQIKFLKVVWSLLSLVWKSRCSYCLWCGN